MNPLTARLLERIWENEPTFEVVASRLSEEVQGMAPAEAAVIGRDLILRRRALYTRDFNLAAYLASNGIAGNDGFIDFTDCVALLPDNRYQRILADPDELINDQVSSEFDELYLVAMVTRVFDRALLEVDEDGGLLDYLILGEDEIDWATIHGGTEEDARDRLPRLYERFGHLLRDSGALLGSRPEGDTVTLNDFLGSATLRR